MLLKPNTDIVNGTIVTPDGAIANRPTVMLSDDDATLLRAYKKLLQKYRLREALYCNDCWTGDRHDGCTAHVTDSNIGVICRCKTRLYLGQSF